MDWNQIIEDNFAAITALAGVLIGLVVSFIQLLITKSLDLKQKELDSQKEYQKKTLVMPIISFVDETLQLMDKAYWDTLDGKQIDITKSLVKLREKESLIKARVLAFDNNLLSKSFDHLSLKYGHFWNFIREGKNSEAYDAKKEALQIAGVIFDCVKPQLKK
jgi:hypothetical protein